jgi:hypothetical protein
MNYQVEVNLVPDLPDDHLVVIRYNEKLLSQDIREGFMKPELLHDYEEFLKHLSHSGILEIAPHRVNEEPDWDQGWEPVDKEYMPLRTFGVRAKRGVKGQRDNYIFFFRSDMIKEELTKEMQDYWIPKFAGLMRYKKGHI